MAETDENAGGGGSDDTAAVEKEALSQGWSPKDQWRGDPDKWIDAKTFVERGKEIMPILQANNRKLQQKVDGMAAEITRVTKLLEAGQEAIAALRDFNSVSTRQQAEQTKKDILAGIKKAKESDDIDAEMQLTEQLGDVNAILKESKAEKKAGGKDETKPNGEDKGTMVDEATMTEFAAWNSRNPWYGTDKRRTRLANVIAAELREDSANAGLRRTAFLDKVTEEVEAEVGSSRQHTDKVEGSRGGSSARQGSGKSYADLPPEAKEACKSFVNRLVGEGRAYKTEKDWQVAYAAKYFAEETTV